MVKVNFAQCTGDQVLLFTHTIIPSNCGCNNHSCRSVLMPTVSRRTLLSRLLLRLFLGLLCMHDTFKDLFANAILAVDFERFKLAAFDHSAMYRVHSVCGALAPLLQSFADDPG